MSPANHGYRMEDPRETAVMQSVRALADDIGPRLCGSEAEHAAAEWLAAQLGQSGCEVRLDTFPAHSTFVAVYAPLAMAAVLAWVTAWWCPIAGGLLAVVMGIVLALENRSLPILSPLVARKRSHNVVALRRPAARPTQDIVILAHIDSGLASDVRNPKLVRALYLGMVASCGLVGLTAVVAWLTGSSALLLVASPGVLLLAACAGIMLHQLVSSRVVPGAGDNASGVAAMLQAAHELPPLQCSTVWFVGDGGEEAGLQGALRFVKQTPLVRNRTWFINVDTVSGGTLQASAEEGMLFRYRCDPFLCRIAAEEGAAEGFTVVSQSMRDMSTDACVPLSRGYRATTLSSATASWHQLSDTVANVDPSVVARAAVLIRRMVLRLDAECSS